MVRRKRPWQQLLIRERTNEGMKGSVTIKDQENGAERARERDESEAQLEGVSGCIWGMLVMCLPHFAWGLEGMGGSPSQQSGPP
jgi:hypothetical protein